MDKEGNIEEKEQENEKGWDEKQIRQMKIILGIALSVIGIMLVGFFIIDNINHFEYNGIKFNVEEYGDLIVYNSAYPIKSPITGQHIADYNIYLRNDPRKLKSVPLTGNVVLKDEIIINAIDVDNCEDRVIAIPNMNNIYNNILGKRFFKNESLNFCDSSGAFTYVLIQNSTESSIKQFGPSCYYLNVNNCEILKVTERFILETLPEQ